MGILDDAIREHLDLKRQHGAREAELREIEDEALGSGDQPDPFSAATATEEPPPGLGEPPSGGEEPTRLVEPEALQRDPEAPAPESDPFSSEPESDLGLPDLPQPPAGGEPETPAPGESLEDLIAEEEPFPEDTAAPQSSDTPLPAETPLPEHTPLPEETPLPEPAPFPEDTGGPPPVSPGQESLDVPALESDDEQEPPLEPADSGPDPPPPPPDTGPEPPGRARGRVDVPTQEHPPPGETGGLPPLPPEEPEYRPDPLEPAGAPEPDDAFGGEEPGAPSLYDFETDEDSVATSDEPAAEPEDDFEALGPAEEEAPYLDEEEPYAEEPGSPIDPPTDDPPTDEPPADEPPADEPSTAVRPSLEEEGESDDEDLWFEKGPPKDFDFDD